MFNVKTYYVSHTCVISNVMFCIGASREFASLEWDNPTPTNTEDEIVFRQGIFK